MLDIFYEWVRKNQEKAFNKSVMDGYVADNQRLIKENMELRVEHDREERNLTAITIMYNQTLDEYQKLIDEHEQTKRDLEWLRKEHRDLQDRYLKLLNK